MVRAIPAGSAALLAEAHRSHSLLPVADPTRDAFEALRRVLPADTMYTMDAGRFFSRPIRSTTARHRRYLRRWIGAGRDLLHLRLGVKVACTHQTVVSLMGDGPSA